MKKENSVKDWQGIPKKIGYWIMITFAFMIAVGLIEIDEIISVDLQITTSLRWFVLTNLIMNEARSIYGNFVEAGSNVPGILNNGLAVVDEPINKESEDEKKRKLCLLQDMAQVTQELPDADTERLTLPGSWST